MSYSSNMGNCNMIKNYNCHPPHHAQNSCVKPVPPMQPCNCNCGCGSNCSECAKYKEVANKKCDQATYLSNEASQVANKARQLEGQIKILACEANDLWKRYEELSDESMLLMEEAKRALEAAIQCYKNCHLESGYNPNLDCNFNNPCNCGCTPNPQPRC